MKKIIENDPSFYRLNLGAGNVIYFSHAQKVRDEEYVDLTAKDLVNKIDELVVAYDTLVETNKNLSKQLAELKLAKSTEVVTPEEIK